MGERFRPEMAPCAAPAGLRLPPGRSTASDAPGDRGHTSGPGTALLDATHHGPDPARAVLVVQTWSTYLALGWAAEQTRWSGTVLWGRGHQASRRIRDAATRLPRPREVWHFGDVDAVSLQAAHAVVSSTTEAGWPRPRPAVGLYRLLARAGEPVPAAGRPARLPAWFGPWLAGWFDDSALAARVLALAALGRLRQDTLSRSALVAQPLGDVLAPAGRPR